MKNTIILYLILVVFTFSPLYAQNNRDTYSAAYDYATQRITLIPAKSSKVSQEVRDFFLNKENYLSLYQPGKNQSDEPSPTAYKDEKIQDLLNYRGFPIGCDSANPNDKTICQKVSIPVNKQLTQGFYMLRIRNLTQYTNNTSEWLYFNVGAAPSPAKPVVTIDSSLDGSRDEIRIVSDKDITVNRQITVINEGYKISADNKRIEPLPAPTVANAVVQTFNDNQKADNSATQTGKEFLLKLNEKLPAARTNNLSIETGITSNPQVTLPIKGKIKVDGLPASPTNLKIETVLSFVGAVHSGPVYDIDFKYNSQDDIRVGKFCPQIIFNSTPCFWQPQITVDIGFSKSTSNNSIVVDMPFRSIIEAGSIKRYNRDSIEDGKKVFEDCPYKDAQNNEDVAKCKIYNNSLVPNYYGWTKTNPFYSNIYFFLGPKFEMDKRFNRMNVLGSLRFEFRPHRLLASIKDKTGYLTGNTYGVEKERSDLVEINSGFTFIPYIGLDFGRKIRDKVKDTKKGINQDFPKAPIFRAYAGFTNTFETPFIFGPMNITLEERFFYLGREESVHLLDGATIKTRNLRGLHHYGKLSFDFFFDKIRRYAFNISLENGRQAPNFEYINKVSAGFKFKY